MNGDKKKKSVFDFSDMGQEKPQEKPKKRSVSFDFSDMPEVKEPERIVPEEEILGQTYGPDQMKGASTFWQRTGRELEKSPIIQAGAQPAKTFIESLNLGEQRESDPLVAGIRAATGIPLAMGEMTALPFTIGDATLREVGLAPVADVAAAPFHLAAQGVRSGEQALDTILRSVAGDKVADMGLSPEQSQKAGGYVSALNQLASQFLVPAIGKKGVDYAKGRIAKVGEVKGKPVETVQEAPKTEAVEPPTSIEVEPTPAPEALRKAGELQKEEIKKIERIPKYAQQLVDIENELGVFSNRVIPKSVKRDAGKLYDAIAKGDYEAASVIEKKYAAELKKGDVQGGPKEVAPGDIVKKTIAQTALNFRADKKAVETKPPTETVGKQPWEMSRKEWESAREATKPNYAQSNFTKASGSQAAAAMSRSDFLRYGVTEAARRRMQEAAEAGKEGKTILSPEELEALQERLNTPVTHRDVIQKALSEGKPVSPEVLKDYPDLATKQVDTIPPEFKKKMVTELGPDTMTRFGKVSGLSEADLGKAWEELKAKPKAGQEVQVGQAPGIPPESYQVRNTEQAIAYGKTLNETQAKAIWEESKRLEELTKKSGEYGEQGHRAHMMQEQVESFLATKEGWTHETLTKQRTEQRLQRPVTVDEKVAERPLHEIPVPVSDEIRAKADELQKEIPSFTTEMVGSKLVRTGEFPSESEVVGHLAGGQVNTYPSWWGEVGANKQRIIEALEKIKQDQGKDKGALVERLKKILHEELLFGAERGDAGNIPPSDIYGQMIDAWKGGKLDEFLSQKPAVPKTEVKPEAVDKISPMQEARTRKILAERITYEPYGTVTRQEFIDRKLAEGGRVETRQISDEAQIRRLERQREGLRETAPLGNPQHPESKRLKAVEEELRAKPTKTEYVTIGVDGKVTEITKTEYDYAQTKKETVSAEQGAIFEETAKGKGGVPFDPLDVSDRAIEDFEGAMVSDVTRMPLGLDVVAETGKPVSSTQVISSIADIMKAAGRDMRIRTGRFRQKALGVFKVDPEVIRLRTANNIPTAAHEAAHALQKILYGEVTSTVKALGGAPREVRVELYKLGKALYGDRKAVAGYTSEGFAEFMRYYLTRDDAQTVAPKMYERFQEILKSNPKIAEAIAKAKETVDSYRKQGALQRAEANLDKGPTVEERIKKAWNAIRRGTGYEVIDEFAPLQRLSQAAEARGVKLKPGEDPFQVASYLRGNAPATVHYMVQDGMIDFARNKVGPALQDISSIVRGRKEDFTKYLWARRSQERLAKGLNPGMTKADADFIVAKLGSPEFELAAQKVYDWNSGVLRYVKEAVPDLAPTVEKILSESENYVPLMRVIEGERIPGEGTGGNALKKFKGSGLRVKDIFPQMIANAQQMISMAHRRRVLDSVIKLSDVEGMGRFVEEIPRDMVPVSKELSEIVKALEAKGAEVSGIEIDGLMTLFTPMKYPKGGGDPIIPAMKDGKLRWFQVDPEVYRVLEGVDLYRLPKVLDMLVAAPVRIFRLGTTGLRPAFSLITNPARDIQTFITQSRSEKNPAQLAAAWGNAMAQAINPRRLKKESPNFDLFYRLGVNMSQPLGPDIGITRKAATSLFKGKTARIVSSPIQAARELLSITESVPRVAEITLMAEKVGWDMKSPMTFDQAVELGLAGKRVTTDFTAAGRTVKKLNQMIPFLNANVQGSRTFARTLRDNPTGATVKALTTLTIPTLLLWWQNKDEEWYTDMPDREKFLYWHFPVGDEMIKIPRAFEWGNFFSVVPEAIFDSWYRKDPEGVKAAIGHIVETTNPVALPHVLQTAKEQWQNRIDFFDRPIVPRAEEDLAPGEQYGPYTSAVAKFLGKNFPESISPRRVDHLTRAIGGGATADLLSAIEGIAGDERRKSQGMSEFPVIGPGLFRRGGVEGQGSKMVERFYDELQKAKRESRSQVQVEDAKEKNYRRNLEDAAKALKGLYLLRDLSQYGGTTENGQELQRLIKMIAADALRGKRSPETRQAFKEVMSRGVEVSENRFKGMKRKEQIEALRRMNTDQRAKLRGYVQPQ